MRDCKILKVCLCLLGLISLLVPSGLALASGIDGGFEQEVDGYQFKLVFEAHAKTGQNEVELQVTAPDGSPVRGATIELSAQEFTGEHMEGEVEPHSDAIDSHEAEAGHGEAVDSHEADAGHGEAAGKSHSMDGPEMSLESEAEHAEMMGEEDHGERETDEELEDGGHEAEGGHGEAGGALLEASEAAGLYHGEIFFSKPGDWLVSVRVELEGEGEKSLEFPVDVIDAGPPWGVLSGFLGVNLAVVAVAGVLKRKSAMENIKLETTLKERG